MDQHVTSPSLLKRIGETKIERISSNFCLGIADFCQCENCKPSEEIETSTTTILVALWTVYDNRSISAPMHVF